MVDKSRTGLPWDGIAVLVALVSSTFLPQRALEQLPCCG